MKVPTSIYQFLSKITLVVSVKKLFDLLRFGIFRVRQVYRKYMRVLVWSKKLKTPMFHSYRFCVLAVKRTVYIDMVIDQINSMHYYNPYHVFDILCDAQTLAYFKTRVKRLDYPQNTVATLFAKEKVEHWQISKIEALLYAIQRDGVLLDADMYWFSDPLIRQWQILFFTRAYKISDQKLECDLVKNVFNRSAWQAFDHYVTALVYFPYCFYTPVLRKELLAFTHKILPNKKLSRIAEELAINLSVQSRFGKGKIAVLKTADSPGDKHTVMSLYYGCMHQIVS